MCLLHSPDFLGSIAGVKLIKPIPQGGKLVIFPCCVHTVVNGDIAHLIFRENDFDKLPGFQVVPAQAGKVFRYDRRHVPGLNLAQHGLQPLALKTHPGKAIINEKAGIQKGMFICIPL